MRKGLMILMLLLSLSAAFCQSNPEPIKPEIRNLKFILNDLGVGLYTGMGDKQVERIGDSAALNAIKLYTLADLNQEKNVIALARLIEISFSNPTAIVDDIDSTPKWSYIVLSFLKSVASSEASEKAVQIATSAVKKQCLKIAASDQSRQACQLSLR